MKRKFLLRCGLTAVISFVLLSGFATAADLALLRNGFTIRHERREVIGANTRLFLGSSDSGFVDVPTSDIEGFEKDLTLPLPPRTEVSTPPASVTTDLNQVVNTASAAYHLDPDLVNSVIHAESGFHSRAVSRKGALGLMQLMPGTAGQLGVTNPLDPKANVEGGTTYHLSKGDVITVPARTPHWFKEVQTPTIAYYAINLEP